MKIKTSELTGAALDWAVAEAMKPSVNHPERFGIATFGPLFRKGYKYPCWGTKKYSPSTDWAQGGPIIKRELNNLFKQHSVVGASPTWTGVVHKPADGCTALVNRDGPTPLIAAMRCFVASKLGDEVNVPEELL